MEVSCFKVRVKGVWADKKISFTGDRVLGRFTFNKGKEDT